MRALVRYMDEKNLRVNVNKLKMVRYRVRGGRMKSMGVQVERKKSERSE